MHARREVTTHQLEAVHLVHRCLKPQPLGHLAQLYRDVLGISCLTAIEDCHAPAIDRHGLLAACGPHQVSHCVVSISGCPANSTRHSAFPGTRWAKLSLQMMPMPDYPFFKQCPPSSEFLALQWWVREKAQSGWCLVDWRWFGWQSGLRTVGV